MSKKRITATILAFLVFSDILETFSQLCFKKTALSASAFNIAHISQINQFIAHAATSGFLWLGFISVLATFVIWSTILSKIDLSVAVPVASFSYILVPITSIIFLHESVGLLRWLGIGFILVGVILVSSTSKEDK
jgi:drug/metabolite transporter (DMT)-like permease